MTKSDVDLFDMSFYGDGIRVCEAVSPTLTAHMGTGGNRVPLCFYPVVITQTGSDGIVTYRICSSASNAMNSKNPLSGVGKVSISPTLDTTVPSPAKGQGGLAIVQHKKAFCLAENSIGRQLKNGCNGKGVLEDCSYTLNATGVHGVMSENEMRVRRLTPRECERLQGFKDDWTLISWRGKNLDKCPDAPRYKAIGNSWAVPVVRWIGKRILKHLIEIQNARKLDER